MNNRTMIQRSVKFGLAVTLCFIISGLGGRPASGGAVLANNQAIAAEQALVDAYCIGCHNQTVRSGNLDLEGVDVSQIAQHAEIGEKMIRKMRAGLMPPLGMPRPSPAEFTALISSLETKLDAAAAAAPYFPSPGLHRLNRREYENSIRELLALEVNPGAIGLPVDDTSHGFDNIAGSLGSSPALVEAYVSAAAKISRLALGHETAPARKEYHAPPDYSQNRHVEGLPFGTRGGMLVQHYFPVDGEYAFNWTPVRSNAGGIFGSTAGEQLELSIDGERVKVWNVASENPRNMNDERFVVRVPVKAGLRSVAVAFLSMTHVPSGDYNDHFERTTLTQNLGGFTFAPHVNAISVTGPFGAMRPENTPSRDKIFVCRPANAAEELPCATTILSSLARQAYRRPVTDRDIEILLGFYNSGRSAGDFEDGIRLGLQMILADPEFVYRTEPVPQEGTPGPIAVSFGQGAGLGQSSYPVSELELASRLSFFLWSSPPDEELLTLASNAELRNPGVLEAQVRRMLADSRSRELVRNFAGQWLQLRNLQSAAPASSLFPNFDDNLRQAFRTETEMLFESIIREDRNVADLLDADYTFVDERLAKHYGIPNVYGSRFRRVELGPEFDMRRGLLGQGSILTVTSVADRTSPVKRGAWVLTNILGVLPPDPPANVPPLEESAEQGQVIRTMRQRMEVHGVNPGCAGCHRMMDPIGFALESFNAIGEYRNTDGGYPLVLSGQLTDGTAFDGASELRRALLAYSPQFVQTLTERLLTYALGRGVAYYDMPVVRSIVRDAAAEEYRFSALVMGIVNSPPFQRNQYTSDSVAVNRE